MLKQLVALYMVILKDISDASAFLLVVKASAAGEGGMITTNSRNS